MTHQNFDQMRHAMVVSQLRTNAVDSPRVIDAMATIPRERFVPAERRSLAYVDVAIPLGTGDRALNPALTSARLITALAPDPGARVLLIGAATGYLATVLARMGCHVIAVESDADLAVAAREALAGESAVAVVEGALTNGSAADAPFDALLIDGAVESVPEALVMQLREGGQAAYAWWDRGVTRLCAGPRVGASLSARPFIDMQAVRLPGFSAPASFKF